MNHPVIARQQPKTKPKQSQILDCFVGLRPPRNDGSLFVLILTLFFSLSLFAAEPSAYKTVPEFSFIDQQGKPVTSADLSGKIWIANFVFTRCQAMCPLLTGKMAQLEQKLSSEKLRFVSFSVDPEHDTPAILAQYAAAHQAISGRWFFLTTEKNKTMWEFISGAFMLGTEEASAEDIANGAEPVMHSSRFVLIDGEGKIRGYYDSEDPQKMEELVHDALSLRGSIPSNAEAISELEIASSSFRDSSQ